MTNIEELGCKAVFP